MRGLQDVKDARDVKHAKEKEGENMGIGFSHAIPRMLVATSAVALAAWLPAGTVAAQNITSSSIDGVVTDQSGATLPGVTVTITSPALQVPQLTSTTDTQGFYRFIDLPRGTYQLRFDLQGFDPVVRQGLELNAGFAARINVSLKVGSLQETVTVSGASPVVDLTTTRGGQNVSTDLITIALPGLKQMADVINVTPGLHSTDGYKPGAIGLNGRSRFNTYGIDSGNTNVTVMVDGFKIIANSQPDFANTVETDVKTYGNSAEVKEAGALINMVTKSGGNDFRGRVSESYMWQPADNLSPELTARGLTVGTSLQYYNDLSADLGGRIVRDKLWFFGSIRDRRNETTRPGLVLDPGPDGVYLTGDEPAAFPTSRLRNPTIKGSYQATTKYQVVADYAREVTNSDADYQKTIFNAQSTANPDFTHIAWEATQVFQWIPTRWKFEFKGTPSNHLFFDAQFGRSTYLLDYLEQPVCGTTPPTYDRNTLMLTGCGIQQQSDFLMWVGDGSLTYVPSSFLGGSHEFKMGYQLSLRDITGNSAIRPSGNYALMFDVVNGVPHQPVQFETANAPVEPDNWDNVYSAYFADQWRLGQRLTFNLGIRYDYQHSYVPEQRREAGPFAAAATFPRRGRTVGTPRAAGRSRVGRHRPRQDGAQSHLRLVQHRGGDFGGLQPVHDFHDRLPLARRERRWQLPDGRSESRYQRSRLHQHDERGERAHQPGPAAVARARDDRLARARARAESRGARTLRPETDRRLLHDDQRAAALQRVQHPDPAPRSRSRRSAQHGRRRPDGHDLRLRPGLPWQQLRR